MNDLMHVKGLSALARALETLPARIEANVMRGAMRAGAKVIATDAKARVNRISGALADSIRYGVKLERAQGRIKAYVRAGGKGPAWYARLVESGTRAHLVSVREQDRPTRLTRRGVRAVSMRTLNRMVQRGSLRIGSSFVGPVVQHPGARPKPFLRPALDARALDAVVAVREYVRRRLAQKHGIDVPGPDDRDDAES